MTTMRKLIDIVNETYIMDSVASNKQKLEDDLKKISRGDMKLTWEELTDKILDAEYSDEPETRKEGIYLRELEKALHEKSKATREEYKRLEQKVDEYDQQKQLTDPKHYPLGVTVESVVQDVLEFMSEQDVNYWPTLLGATYNQIESSGIKIADIGGNQR